MAGEKILVVDDEEDLLKLLSYNLVNSGYQVECVTSGEETLVKARANPPDLVLLDLMLPGIDGLDTCRILKSDSITSQIPVVMLTAKGEESDIVSGLELGAEDYITKPFSPRVLTARIKAVFRRGHGQEKADVLNKSNISMNVQTRAVFVEGKSIDLTATEFKVLQLLMRRAGWVYTRNQIINAVKGDDYPVTARSIDVQIVGLRKKLGEHGKKIETVRGVGYRFREM